MKIEQHIEFYLFRSKEAEVYGGHGEEKNFREMKDDIDELSEKGWIILSVVPMGNYLIVLYQRYNTD